MNAKRRGKRREVGSIYSIQLILRRVTAPPSDFCDYHDRKCNTFVLIGNFRYRNSRIGRRESDFSIVPRGAGKIGVASSIQLGFGLLVYGDVSVQFAISNG